MGIITCSLKSFLKTNNGIEGNKVYAFGEFTFNAQKDDPSVTFRVMLQDGNEHYKLTLSQSQLTPK